jgi:hypothetical protein
MKALTSLAAILALAALPAFAEDKAQEKSDSKPETKPAAAVAEPAKPEQAAKDVKRLSAEERFKRMDKDGNGSVSLEEFRGKKNAEGAGEAFKKLDTNSDGALSLEEFSAGGKKKEKKEKKQ